MVLYSLAADEQMAISPFSAKISPMSCLFMSLIWHWTNKKAIDIEDVWSRSLNRKDCCEQLATGVVLICICSTFGVPWIDWIQNIKQQEDRIKSDLSFIISIFEIPSSAHVWNICSSGPPVACCILSQTSLVGGISTLGTQPLSAEGQTKSLPNSSQK